MDAEGELKEKLEAIARELSAFCKERGVDLIQGHDGVLLVKTDCAEMRDYIDWSSAEYWQS